MKKIYTNACAQKGFVKPIILTILALVLINIFFGFDLVEFLNKETLHKLWEEDIVVPAMFIWDKIIIGFIWGNITRILT